MHSNTGNHPNIHATRGVGRMRLDVDFDQAPLLLIWEVTRSCELACVHCRASAIHQRHPDELTLAQGKDLIEQVRAMGTPLIIFTGGDPLQRDDLEELIRHAKSVGLRAGTIPATTYRLTRERLESLKAAGVDQLALSIDGENEAKHDAFRQVPGSFAKAMEAARWVSELEIPLQINTVFGSWNAGDFDALAELVESLGIVFWEVFFLVPTGRGTELQSCSTEQFEALFAKLEAMSRRVPFMIKITEGQHYRRFLAERKQQQGENGAGPSARMPKVAVNAGRGFCFVDHVGDVYPSGFLPMACGNVKEQAVADIYRSHETFRALRDTSKLEGKCGRCRYQTVCGGGSRARAFALTGRLHAPEPFCAYMPE